MKAGVLPKITSALLYVFWNNLKNGDDNTHIGCKKLLRKIVMAEFMSLAYVLNTR